MIEVLVDVFIFKIKLTLLTNFRVKNHLSHVNFQLNVVIIIVCLLLHKIKTNGNKLF